MPLDIRTLVAVAMLVSIIMGAGLLLTWSINRSMRALRFWSAAYLFDAAGLYEILARDPLPPSTWNQTGVALLALGHLCMWFGSRRLDGKSLPWAAAGALFLALMIACGAFPFVTPDYTGRFVAYSLFVLIVSGSASFELFRSARDGLLSPTGVLGGLCAIIAVSNGARGLVALLGGGSEGVLSETPMQAQLFLQATLMIVSTGICMVVVTTERLQRELRRSASYDYLTGVLNRGAFVGQAEREMARWRRTQAPFSILVLDIDHFKRINDSFGHGAGDAMLTAFARVCAGCLRDSDLFGRYGGEEFCALLPDTDRHRATQVADRLRQSCAALVIEHNGARISTTVSIGVAEVDSSVAGLNGLIGVADAALYRAKKAGRDRVVAAEPVAA